MLVFFNLWVKVSFAVVMCVRWIQLLYITQFLSYDDDDDDDDELFIIIIFSNYIIIRKIKVYLVV